MNNDYRDSISEVKLIPKKNVELDTAKLYAKLSTFDKNMTLMTITGNQKGVIVTYVDHNFDKSTIFNNIVDEFSDMFIIE